jgi:hypothetical protein
VRSNYSVKVQTLNSSDEDQKVEVLLDTKDGEGIVMLKYSTWTEGLGWTCQKTIQLESHLLDDLHHALTIARMKINRQKIGAGKEIETAKVIHLPCVA